ncbi:probable ATP-dependent RNA helicase DDX43 [Procambarus clarkii]|uniref:probable ATP-dependent RNA helicase DDX43 n=1 Tax=Procambarus clarkii TaxID=6728 RepID=UPI00374356B6
MNRRRGGRQQCDNYQDSFSGRGRYRDNVNNRGNYSYKNQPNQTYASQKSVRSSNSDSNWECQKCNFSNYSNRVYCFKCGDSKGSRSSSHDSPQWKKEDSFDRQRGQSSGQTCEKGYHRGENKYEKSEKCEPANEGLIDWDALIKASNKYEAERLAALPPLQKNLYVEDPEVKILSEKEVQNFRKKNFNITVRWDDGNSKKIPKPVLTFKQAFGPYPELLAEIERMGFETPSPIQCQSWPILMQGHDMIGIAQTGTGKTLAFLLPALLHIVAQPTPRWERVGPTCLVLAPTRELAQQIEKEVSKYQYENIRCVCVYGQGDKNQQIQKINAKSEIVIATPGRLNEFTSKRVIDLSGVSYLVLDEADRMLDMGFEHQIRKIVLDIRPDKQCVMTSATWPEDVRDLAKKLLKDPIHVVVGSLALQAVHTVTQHVTFCTEDGKKDELLKFIKGMATGDKAIVFVGRKVMVDHLSVLMLEAGQIVQSMHGDREQCDREEALNDLKTGKVKVLIATDVAARGIDVTDVTHILNYDCPRDMEEYVHRVGRTGRAGRTGCACTLVTREDWKTAGKLIEILKKSNQEVHPELYRMKERWEKARTEKNLRENTSRYRNRGPQDVYY